MTQDEALTVVGPHTRSPQLSAPVSEKAADGPRVEIPRLSITVAVPGGNVQRRYQVAANWLQPAESGNCACCRTHWTIRGHI
jgi:hypothetical protein